LISGTFVKLYGHVLFFTSNDIKQQKRSSIVEHERQIFVLSVISDKGNSKFSMPGWYWDVSGSLKTSHFIPYLFRRDLIISKKMSPSSWWNFHMTFNFFTSHTQQFSTQKIVTKCNVISNVCMCVLKTQTLLPSLQNDIRIKIRICERVRWTKKKWNEFRMSFLSVHVKTECHICQRNLFKMHHIIIWTAFSKLVFIVEYSSMPPISVCGRLNTWICPWLNLFR